MIVSLRRLLARIARVFGSREDPVPENLALSVGNHWLCTRNGLAVD
jgi:hypothetical protein